MKRRIAFLHTSRAHVETFDGLLADLDVTLHHSVEPSWLERARRAGIDLVLLKEVRAHLEALAGDADLVICTCTTLGPIAESMNDARIHRLDAPVMDAAVAVGGSVLLVLCLESTEAASRELLERAFTAAGRTPNYRLLRCSVAWPAFEAGAMGLFAETIATWVRTALTLEPSLRSVVLAQASMHAALPALSDIAVPVLSSPVAAVERIRAQLTTLERETLTQPVDPTQPVR